jgi:Tol biopolymer transport system component
MACDPLLVPSAHAAFPGHNGKIAFVRGGDIYTIVPDVAPDDADLTQLTSGPARDLAPAWSPDGTRIAFETDRNDPNAGTCGEQCNWEIYVMNADGSGVSRLTMNSIPDRHPAWSPDGSRLVFDRNQQPEVGLVEEIWFMNADGSGQTQLTHESGDPTFTYSFDPAWSPDSGKISFTRFDGGYDQVFVMNLDGSGQTQLTSDVGDEREANWSPDGEKIAYMTDPYNALEETFCAPEVYVMGRDGSGKTSLTPRSPGNPCPLGPGGFAPAWSPNANKIVFLRSTDSIYIMNSNGSNPVPLTTGAQPDWQPIPIKGYPRPKGATPFQAYLTVAYQSCDSPNNQHGAPLAMLSCSPAQQASDFLTVGTLDANSQQAKSVGSLRLDVKEGDPATSANEADLNVAFSVKDIRNKSDLSDYTGSLRPHVTWRITDKFNGAIGGSVGSDPATLTDIQSVPIAGLAIPCAGTADSTIGSTCAATTTFNAFVPNAIVEKKAMNLELGQVQVYDGGADGDASTLSDNTLFMDEGVFVP